MKKQGLDPWNTDDIDKYRSGQGSWFLTTIFRVYPSF
jgi:hypothetical protein